ncbi:hypothetical protein CkaCkLH20_00298 [Colletotrichum karsti]|uniref:Lipase B n=1 Tax=Colletotrichum karsti TaxID=1095194 RepID=A0A9P6IGT1_9PEZI|nr:uncharacterized protein CkaCkLH20_00298 [Colletotrichum karsti]KAF9882262.1 hypothetical protein CkaCkLH20_00298 [Colletotrichum karsti]
MKTAPAALFALAWTTVHGRPVSDPEIEIRDIVNNNQTAVESNMATQNLNPFLGEDLDSTANSNPKPKNQIYPKRSEKDAPYSLSEEELRSKIYIPKTFSATSNKQPVILIPGTAAMAGSTFRANLGPLLTKSDFADPLWVNIPQASLGDAQVNSEYVAYAMNYVQDMTGKKAAVAAWSQGNLNAQWALKYWPSTRDAVTDLVSFSPDFHGTTEAFLACNTAAAVIGCTPSVYQQKYDSKFVTTLRANGGDSAYVPTTSIFSATDEIVQPQSGPKASAILKDGNGVQTTNVEVQQACPGTPAGTQVTHEGMLYNSLAFALMRDALTNEGPAKLERIDKSVCKDPAAGKMDKAEISATEAVLGEAGANVLKYKKKVTQEPAIKSYA